MAEALVAALAPSPDDVVLEIGPGKGILTKKLVSTAARVIAVEIDQRLAAGLRSELGGWANLEVVQGDFMDFDLTRYQRLKVMGNLPYNLSSQVLFRLLDFLNTWDTAVLTLQREFARRVTASPGTKAYGAISVFLDRLTIRERLFNLEPRCFKPRPDVVSTSLRLTRRGQPLFPVQDETWFRRVVKLCFAQRRKTVANNLVAGLGLEREAILKLLAQTRIPATDRAENLTGEQFRLLADSLAEPGRNPR